MIIKNNKVSNQPTKEVKKKDHINKSKKKPLVRTDMENFYINLESSK